MKFLAFEASTTRLSVALWCEGEVTEMAALIENGGSEHLLPWADTLLRQHGLTVRQLEGIAFGAGPGGFTGLRLACGIAQGLAFAWSLPVAPVSSLAALAWGVGEGEVLACLDARMGEVYLAAYRVTAGGIEESLPACVGAASQLPLPEAGAWFGVGNGFASHGEMLRARLGGNLVAVREDLYPTAKAVAQLAAPILARGGGVPARAAEPLYVREKVAFTIAERLARGGRK